MSPWEKDGVSDDWYTPKYIFAAMQTVFDIDVAAPKEGPRHVPYASYFSTSSLAEKWPCAAFVWMNPPFGKRNAITPWLEKFIIHRNGVALVPDRTSAPWFQQAAKQVDALLFLSPKVKFERPDGSVGASPGCGTVLMALGVQGVSALTCARRLGLLLTNV